MEKHKFILEEVLRMRWRGFPHIMDAISFLEEGMKSFLLCEFRIMIPDRTSVV